MKLIKRCTSVLLALVMMLAMSATAFAANDGSITVSNAVKGTTYSAYKIFDATYSGDAVSYTIPDGSTITSQSGFTDVFQTTVNGGKTYVTLKKGVADSAVVSFLKTYVSGASLKADKSVKNTNDDTTVKLEDLAYGYYYVESSPDDSTEAAVSITTVAKNATIVDKNETKPNIDTDDGKKVATSADGTYSSVATMNVGDTAYFKITFNAVNYTVKNGVATQIKKYTITDTPDGFDINEDKVSVKVGEKTLENTAYTIVKGNDGKLTIEIPWVDGQNNSIYASPSDVEIKYTATLTNKNVAKASKNSAEIKYDNDSIPEVPDVEVYNYKIVIDKYAVNETDEANKSTKLEGAQFVLKNENDKFYSVDASTGKVTWKEAQTDATVVTTDENGAANFAGLAAGTYTLVEVKAPDGYNLLAKGTTVTLDAITSKVTNTSTLTVTSSVGNKAGSTLPTTGGMGTTLLYTVGSVLVLGAGVLLVVRRRMNAAE